MKTGTTSTLCAVLAATVGTLLMGLAGCASAPATGPLPAAHGDQPGRAEATGGAALPAALELPLPSTLPRKTSETRPSFHHKGNSVDYFVPPQRVDNVEGKQSSDINDHYLNFEPDWEPGDPFDGLAFAGYMVPLFGEVNGSKRIRYFWKTPPVNADEDFYIAFADFSLNRWVFMRGPEPGAELDLSEDYDNFLSPWGYMYTLVLFTGHDSPSLDHLMVGDTRFLFDSIPLPDSGEGELETTISANCEIEGGFPAHYSIDFENDGVWDVLHSTEPSAVHTYDSPGIYRPRVRAVTTEGVAGEKLGTVYVTNPNNFGPTAILHASTLSGDAPLHVELDGEDSFDDGAGQIIRCEWDMDGDNKYELNTGTELSAAATLVRAGNNKIRMRITDNDLDTAVAFVDVNIGTGFHVTELPGTQMSVNAAPLALCMFGEGQARRPACAYGQQKEAGFEVRFSAATTANGSSWADSHLIASSQNYVPQVSMAEVAGIPAVAYGHYDHVSSSSSVRYSRATNVAGSSWTVPLSVISGTRGQVDLEVVDGHPAIVLAADQDLTGLHYVRASNPSGSAWGSPEQIFDTPYVNNLGTPALISLPGKTPVILCGERSAEEQYSSVTWRLNALDEQGGAFAEPEYFWGTMAHNVNWALQGDKLLFALHGYTPSFNGINYLRVDDLHNATEVSEAVLDVEDGHGFSMAIAVMDGKPVIAYLKSFNIDYSQDFHLAVRFAEDNVGTDWGPEMIVDAAGPSGFGVAMLTTSNQKPLMVFSSEEKDSIMGAAWY